jgi:hypothetical protein
VALTSVFSCRIQFTHLTGQLIGHNSCLVEPDPECLGKYQIFTKDDGASEKLLFGQIQLFPCDRKVYQYSITIGNRLYNVRSCDLRDRRLAIIGVPAHVTLANNDMQTIMRYSETLLEVIDSLPTTNKKYFVTVHNSEKQLGYLAIAILLDLHESQR